MEHSKFAQNLLRSYSHYALFIALCSNIGYEDDLNNRLIPRIYCLLSGKSQIIYERLFQLIIDKANYWNYNVAWEQSMSDFEYSIFNSLAVNFPNGTSKRLSFSLLPSNI